jgi:hypothetical protein
VLYEYWVVVTRPVAQNGLGMAPVDADVAMSNWLKKLRLIHDDADVFATWRHLVGAHGVSGKPAHDARLVAAMVRHGLPTLLTFNAADFRRYTQIAAYTPEDVLNGAI